MAQTCLQPCRLRDMRRDRDDRVETTDQPNVSPTLHDRADAPNDPLRLMRHEARVIAEDPYLTDEQRVADLIRLSDVIRELGRAYDRMGHTEKARVALREARQCLELARTS